ncbi:35787_t:CDS:2, partial [Racocetra persica]
MGVATSFYTGRGLIQATLAAMLFLETVGLKNNVPFSALDEEKVFARMKEHCIANGYYNPNSPPDLVLLKERREKVRKILLEDSNQLYQLLAYADRENYETIVNTK